MYLIREILDLSYPEIGKLFAKHHSTVMYSVETITEERRSNPSLDATLTTFVGTLPLACGKLPPGGIRTDLFRTLPHPLIHTPAALQPVPQQAPRASAAVLHTLD